MKEKLKNITKTDIIASIIYLSLAIAYLILNERYFNLSPNVNFLVLLLFLGSAAFYRNVIKKKPKLIIIKNLIKKSIVLSLVFSLLLATGFVIPNINDNNKTVYAYSTGIGEKRIPISIYFTADECKTIAKKGSKISSWSGWISFISGFAGSKFGLASGLIGAFGMGVANNVRPFETAANRGTGLAVSYTYVIPTYTNIGRTENSKYYYY